MTLDMTSRLDPEIRALLDALPAYADMSLEHVRAIRAAMGAMPSVAPSSDAVQCRDVDIPGDPPVRVRVHTPVGAPGVMPAILSIHGGGFVLGTNVMDDAAHARRCRELGYVGVAVDYRLAPETPYPGPLEDCYTALEWIFDNAESLGVDRERIGVQGNSAGGGLAAGLALLARDRGKVPLQFQLLVYPMLDDRMVTTTSRWPVPTWSPASNRFGWSSYLGDLYGTDDVPAYAAPARATDLSRLPSTFVAVGALDGFCDEDIDYAQRLNHAGVPVELHVHSGAPHGFDSLFGSTAVAGRARRDQDEWLAAQLATSRRPGE